MEWFRTPCPQLPKRINYKWRRQKVKKEVMMRPKFIAVAVLIALFLIILLQNIQPVTLRLFFWKVGMSQIILIPLILAIGVVIGFIIAKITGNKQKRQNRN
jgi:uncharacterized integral membrane protein